MDMQPFQGEVVLLLVALYYRKRDWSPARSGKPDGSYADSYLLQVEKPIMANSRSLNYFGRSSPHWLVQTE